MTPFDFLQAVWPGEGFYCLAIPFQTSDGGRAYRHKVMTSVEAAAKVAVLAAEQTDVFFCVHTLLEPKRANPAKEHGYEVRTQANSKAARAFFFDLDVGEGDKKYPDQATALKSLIQFCKDVQLPKPLVTSSGGGLHVYWLISDALPSADWRVHAAKLKALAKHHGLRADPARTTDSASVLRVVGTFNHKHGQMRPVTALVSGTPTATGVFLKSVDDALIRSDVTVRQNPVYTPQHASPFGSNIESTFEGPAVTMKAVMTACEQMRTVVATREDVDQTTWYHSINVARFVENGSMWAKRISAQHRVERVDDKIAILEEKGIQPSSCLTLAGTDLGDEACGRCPFAGKVKNPIMAARFKDEAVQPKVVEHAGVTTTTIDIPPPPKPYTRLKDGAISIFAKDKEGEERHTIIYENDIYPVRRLVNTASCTEQQMWRVVLPREGAKDFILDADALYDRRKFAVAISNQGIYPAAANLQYLQDYMTAYITELQKLSDAETQCNHLGWTDDHAKFIMPDKIMMEDGTAKTAMLSTGAARSSVQVHKKGSMQRQIELLKFYNFAAYIPNQFMILCGLAAPIFHMTGHNGVIVNASGEAGASKSTTLYTAASFWGNPKLYPINGTNNGATVRGRNERVTVMANLPICVDEITHMPIRDAVDLAMGITQPGHRIRLETSGVERGATGSHKATIMLCTANNSLHGILSTDNTAGTAGSMRVFEIALKAGLVHKKSEADDYLMELNENYGHLGEVFVAHVLQNRKAVEKRVREVMREIDEEGEIAGAERFWSAAAAAVIVAGEIALQLGLLSYDVVAIRRWVMDKQLPMMRGIVREEYSSPLGILTEYLESINGNTIIVQKSSGQQMFGSSVTTMNKPHGQLLAHFDTSERVIWVLKKGFKDYCVRVGANFLKVIEELSEPKVDAGGHSNRIITNKHIRKVLGAGTEMAKAQSWCFTVNISHPEVSGQIDLTVIEGGKKAASK